MDRSSILAHRGLFSRESDKNSTKALQRALEEGFGVETDLRDLNGKIVISHDPPIDNPHLPTFEWLLEQVVSIPKVGRIALNVKSDGLSEMIQSKLLSSRADLDRFFVFDMSIPDSIVYLKSSIPVYSRVSDYERTPAFSDKVRGVWIDNFSGSFPQIEYAKNLIEQRFRVTIVSPELHRRNHAGLWDAIIESGIHTNPLFEICTDFPVEAASRFLSV
jgi:hypothetical protein